MSDLLERATRASRQAPTPAPTPDQTRARILATVRRESVKPPRRLRHGWAIPLVAAVVATGAAAAVGTHPFALFTSPAPAVSATPTAPGAVSPRGPRTAVRSPDAPAEQAAEPLAPTAATTTDALATATTATEPITTNAPTAAAPDTTAAPANATGIQPTTSPSVGTPAAVSTTAPASTARGAAPNATGTVGAAPTSTTQTGANPASTAKNGVNTPDTATAPATDDPAEALYREAHALHFRGGDAGAAVAAWERYLAAAPRGRFAPEARYNRALALLRAGRREAGLAALAPFASAPAGSYRQAEAQRLIEAAGQGR